MNPVPVIDPSADVLPLRLLRGSDYSEAIDRLIEKHGGGCNENGVFLEPERIILAAAGRAKAEVKLAQAPDGLWFTGYDYSYATGEGGGGPASVCSGEAYYTREDAIRAVSDWFAAKFRTMLANEPSGYGEVARTSARQLLAAIQKADNPAQFDLFASA